LGLGRIRLIPIEICCFFLLLRHPYYLLGEVETADGKRPALAGRLDNVETYNPALYQGSILQLHYARAPELGPWLDLVAVRGEGVGGAVLAQAGRGGGDAGDRGGTAGGTDTGAVEAVFVRGQWGVVAKPERWLIPDYFTYFTYSYFCVKGTMGFKAKPAAR
jgi:hypothetical protein